jgi:hypothetical protein
LRKSHQGRSARTLENAAGPSPERLRHIESRAVVTRNTTQQGHHQTDHSNLVNSNLVDIDAAKLPVYIGIHNIG